MDSISMTPINQETLDNFNRIVSEFVQYDIHCSSSETLTSSIIEKLWDIVNEVDNCNKRDYIFRLMMERYNIIDCLFYLFNRTNEERCFSNILKILISFSSIPNLPDRGLFSQHNLTIFFEHFKNMKDLKILNDMMMFLYNILTEHGSVANTMYNNGTLYILFSQINDFLSEKEPTTIIYDRHIQDIIELLTMVYYQIYGLHRTNIKGVKIKNVDCILTFRMNRLSIYVIE